MQNEANSAGLRAIKVVAMGGGTGLSTLLHGLKRYVIPTGEVPVPGVCCRASDDLSAIVTVSDDGGSSSRLRKELNVPAPGDVRELYCGPAPKTRPCCRGFFNTASLPGREWEDTTSETSFFRR